jgi:putative ABC transport system substrate-binding protein
MAMRRRDVLGVLGGAIATALPPRDTAHSQPRLRTLGFLGTGTPSSQGAWLSALRQRLHELNWIEGRTITLEVRWAEGRTERYAEIATEFVRLRTDVIVTSGGAVPALMKATSEIPIVFGVDGDPVGRGLVASLARPGGNVTGLSALQPELAGKRLGLLREMLPQLRRLAVMGNAGFAGALQEINEVQVAGGKLGIEVVAALIRRAEDIALAFDGFHGTVAALYVCGDALTTSQQRRINTLALAARLPTIFGTRGFAETGGLVAYGPNLADLHRRAGEYVDKILRGSKPGDLPVEQAIKFDLVINLTTAKSIALTIAPTLLARADEVIE